MKKNVFYALMMPALLLGTVACTDYQNDIDKLGTENEALRSYNNETISRLNSVVFQTEDGVVNITVDEPKTSTIVYEVEPKDLAPVLASDLSRLSFVSQHGATMKINAATANAEKGMLVLTGTPSGFTGDKDFSLSLVYTENGRSFQTAYTPVYVVSHPTAGSLSIYVPTTASGKYAVGATYQMGAVFYPSYITETEVSWSVDDTTLATIDAYGMFTPLKNGMVTITCVSKDQPSVKASVTIEVTGGNLPLNEGGVSQGGAE